MLEFVLAKQLVCTILDERCEVGHELQEHISYVVHDKVLLLTPSERFRKARVDHVDFLAVAEDSADELLSAVLWDWRGRGVSERLHPEITKVLQILHEIPFGVHQLRNNFLALLLLVRDAISDILRHGVDPQLLLFVIHVFVQTGTRFFALETGLYPHVETSLLLKAAGTGDGIA
jgi:hypothetical protein